MNERIRQLADQAKDWANNQKFYESHYQDYLMERFAKLIVRECAEMVRIQNEQFMQNESHYGVVSTDVLKHFGVEE
jgi:hypothetical protein